MGFFMLGDVIEHVLHPSWLVDGWVPAGELDDLHHLCPGSFISSDVVSSGAHMNSRQIMHRIEAFQWRNCLAVA